MKKGEQKAVIFPKSFLCMLPFKGSGLENIILQALSLLQIFHKRGNPIPQTIGIYWETVESIQYLLSFVSRFSLCVQNSLVKSGGDRRQPKPHRPQNNTRLFSLYSNDPCERWNILEMLLYCTCPSKDPQLTSAPSRPGSPLSPPSPWGK